MDFLQNKKQDDGAPWIYKTKNKNEDRAVNKQ